MISYALFGLAGVLGGLFRQSKYTYLSVLLAACSTAFAPLPAAEFASAPVWLVAAYLLPLNLLIFTLLPERGLWTHDGLLRSIAVLTQVALLLAIKDHDGLLPKTIREWLQGAMLHPYVAPVPVAAAVLWLAALLGVAVAGTGPRLSIVGRSAPIVAAFLMLCAPAPVFEPLARVIPPRILLTVVTAVALLYAILEYTWRSAYTDELTGLPGRRAFKHDTAGIRGRFCLAIIDIDHFKQVNDRHGHDCGDQVLRVIAARLAKSGIGKVYRHGGEEFVILPQTEDLKQFRDELENLRRHIESIEFHIRGVNRPRKRPKDVDATERPASTKRLPLTVSIGAARSNEDRREIDEVLEAADRALYRAKGRGRNCVSVIR